MPLDSDDWQALKECCKDEAAFLRLQQLLAERLDEVNDSSPRLLEGSTVQTKMGQGQAHPQARRKAMSNLIGRMRREGNSLTINVDRETDFALLPANKVEPQVAEILPAALALQPLVDLTLPPGQPQTYECQMLVQGEWHHYAAQVAVCGEDEVCVTLQSVDRQPIAVSLRESEQKFAVVFQHSQAAISLMTLTGEYLEVNESFCRITGFDRAEIIGSTSLDLNFWVDPNLRQWLRQQMQQHGIVQNVEIEFRKKSGEIGVAWLSSEVVEINEQPCFLGTVHDITDLKAAQTQLQSMNALLEQQVAERTLELQQKMQQLQELSQLQDEFLHAVSHDLRTPLLGMTLVIKHLLHKAMVDLKPSDTVTMPSTVLERMVQSCDRQLSLINSILEAHASETRGLVLRLESVAIGPLIAEIEQDIAPLMAAQQATLVNQIPAPLPAVMADPLQLRRVFENLLSNALQHNPPGLTLTLTATVTSDQICVQLQDNGRGLEGADDRLFDRYVQGNRRQSTSLGLGLYLCRQIIVAHGGTIGVNSSFGQGATFWFTLPLPAQSP
jgi:PAS domain S-box-containing protein